MQSRESAYVKEFKQSKNDNQQSIRELCHNRRLRLNLVFSNVIWCSIMFNYYVIAFYIKYFPGNIFQNTLAFVFSDLFSYVLSGTILKKTNMKTTLILAQSISIVGSLLYLFLYQHLFLIPIIIVLCRFGIGMSFNTVYVGNNRLFPT